METNGFSGGKQCVFTPANENSYVPIALGSYVWTGTEDAISYALYLRVSTGHARNCEKWPNPSFVIFFKRIESLICYCLYDQK